MFNVADDTEIMKARMVNKSNSLLGLTIAIAVQEIIKTSWLNISQAFTLP